MASLLPQHPGWLPTWLLIVSGISFANSIQCYSTLKFTQRVYTGSQPVPDTKDKYSPMATRKAEAVSPVNPLSSRTFGSWTFLTGIVRLYAAYHIEEEAFYQLAMWGYAIALGHFTLEWLVYRTATPGKGLAGPLVVSTSSLIWMVLQYGYYVK